MNTDDRALADLIADLRGLLAEASKRPWARCYPSVDRIVTGGTLWCGQNREADEALIVATVNALPTLLDRLEAFHAKRWTDGEWQRLLRIVHAAITENAPGGLTPGRIDVLADSVMHALDDDQAAALQSPPPVVSTPGVNCPNCGHRLPVDYSGPCVACDAPDVPDLNAPPVVSGEAIDSIATTILRDVCELDGYTSPDDQPDLIQCTTDELDLIVRRALGEDA